jgi:hypothetical protein
VEEEIISFTNNSGPEPENTHGGISWIAKQISNGINPNPKHYSLARIFNIIPPEKNFLDKYCTCYDDNLVTGG